MECFDSVETMMPDEGYPSMLRSNSGWGGQGGGTPSQSAFPSLVSPQQNPFTNLNVLGSNNVPNASSLLHQSFGHGSSQQDPANGGAEPGPLYSIGNGVGFSAPSSPYGSLSMAANPNSSGHVQGQQQFYSPMLTTDQQQFNVPSHSQQQQQHAHQYQAVHHGAGHINVEQQTPNEQSLHILEPQHSDSSLFFPQQQQFLMSPQAQILHQQRLTQIEQHQQQQQPLKSTPQQRPQLQSQFQKQNFPIRSPVKPVYEPGMCARRLTRYLYQQQHRPQDNNIVFWRKFVAEFFARNAKKKLCVSMYGIGRQATGVSSQNVWHCEVCNRKPGRGFEATVEALPRLFKIKYESGTLNELLYVDMPREYQNSSGQIVLEYAKATHESIFEQLRVVRDGQLRIVFSPDLKICSWEFCARCHEELIPRKLLTAQVRRVDTVAQKCQAVAQNTSPGSSVSELQNNCNMFVASAHQLVKTVEVPLVNDLGLSKRYVRCLQLSEVISSMKSLIDFSSETGAGPVESLAKFPRSTNTSPAFQGQAQRPESHHQQQQQRTVGQNSKSDGNNNISSAQPAFMQLASTTANNSTPVNSGPTTTYTNTAANFLRHNSMNSRLQNPPMSNPNTSYVSNVVQTLSPMENSIPISPFQSSPRPSLSNNNNSLQPISTLNMANSPNIGDMDEQSSVQKIIRDVLMSPQFGGIGMVSDAKYVNGSIDGDNNIMSVSGFGSIRNGLDRSNTYGQWDPNNARE